MGTNRFVFEVISQITVENVTGNTKSSLKEISYHFDPHYPLDKSMYFDEDAAPNALATNPITETLIAALSAHIRVSHERGYKNESEHIRYVIDALGKQFVCKMSEPKLSVLKNNCENGD